MKTIKTIKTDNIENSKALFVLVLSTGDRYYEWYGHLKFLFAALL